MTKSKTKNPEWNTVRHSAKKFYQANRKGIHRNIWIYSALILIILCLQFRDYLCPFIPHFRPEVQAAFIGTLGAGIIAFLVAKWQIKKASEVQQEANRNELLYDRIYSFTKEFYSNYQALKVEFIKPIQLQSLRVFRLREFIEKRTNIEMGELINDIKTNGSPIDHMDFAAIQRSGIALSSLIESNQQIVSNRIILNYLAHTNDLTLYDQLTDTWNKLKEFVTSNNTIIGSDALITSHENAINELAKKFEYNDWKLMSIFRPLQKDNFNQLLFGNKIDFAEQLLLQASVWLSLKEYDDCIEVSEKALEYKCSSKAYGFIGCAYFAKNDLPKALENFNKSLSIYPNSVIILEQKAITLIKMGDYKGAFETYKIRLGLDFESYAAIANMIEILIMDNLIVEAQKYLALYQKTAPENTFANKFLAILLSIVTDKEQIDLQSQIVQLKATNDWEYRPWSYDQIGIWIRDDSKTKHLSESQKNHVKQLMAALETERVNDTPQS